MNKQDKLLFWRVLVATTHIDGIVTNDEIRFFQERLEHVDLSAEDRAVISEDFAHKQDAVALFHELSSPAIKAECLSMMSAIFHSDGEFHHLEEKFYAELNKDHHGDIDVEAMIEQISDEIDDRQAAQDNSPHKVSGIIGWISDKIYKAIG
jgi:hypothetical protein